MYTSEIHFLQIQ